ncbi:MAG: Fic family protein [Alphaproteobacteria bacterium]|nr:Fic family protein [Alphaproteobacteria bacterium]MBP7758138.1 Fic family protein [Alphaproteobacteria bacterium]MBP7761429.1 Fic family protein [Alphaproteobacteria bacterium]MBP7903836.1 Fic family protein [Alphaproteobacteria bacterium]
MLGLQHVRITPSMLKLACAVDEFKGAWTALENHTTSLQILGDVSNFGRNLKEIAGAWQDKVIDEEMVCKLHGLFTGSKKVSSYRNGPHVMRVYAKDQVIGELDTASPDEIRALMPRLIKWVAEALEKGDIHPLFVIAIFTAVFLQLCPFEEGNQKLARILAVLLLLKSGYSYAPFSLLDPVFSDKAEEYFHSLKHTQATLASGRVDWDRWIGFFLEVLREQKAILQKRLEKGRPEIANMPSLSTKVLRLFDKHERISMKEIERLTRGKRSTLKLRLGELVEEGYLMRHGKARATWYSRV